MDIAIDFNDKRRFVTVEVNDEPCNDLLPPKMDSQLVRPQFLSEGLLDGCHVAAKLFCALKFFFGNALAGDNAFDGHGAIVIQNPSPLGEERNALRKRLPSHLGRAGGWVLYAFVNRLYRHSNASLLG
jgi:hypothetical protein